METLAERPSRAGALALLAGEATRHLLDNSMDTSREDRGVITTAQELGFQPSQHALHVLELAGVQYPEDVQGL